MRKKPYTAVEVTLKNKEYISTLMPIIWDTTEVPLSGTVRCGSEHILLKEGDYLLKCGRRYIWSPVSKHKAKNIFKLLDAFYNKEPILLEKYSQEITPVKILKLYQSEVTLNFYVSALKGGYSVHLTLYLYPTESQVDSKEFIEYPTGWLHITLNEDIGHVYTGIHPDVPSLLEDLSDRKNRINKSLAFIEEELNAQV